MPLPDSSESPLPKMLPPPEEKPVATEELGGGGGEGASKPGGGGVNEPARDRPPPCRGGGATGAGMSDEPSDPEKADHDGRAALSLAVVADAVVVEVVEVETSEAGAVAQAMLPRDEERETVGAGEATGSCWWW